MFVLPNTTSETSGALNSMGSGGTNQFNNLLLLYNLSLIQNTKLGIYSYAKTLIYHIFFDVLYSNKLLVCEDALIYCIMA